MVRNPLRLEYELCLGTGSSFGYSKRPIMIHHKHRWENPCAGAESFRVLFRETWRTDWESGTDV